MVWGRRLTPYNPAWYDHACPFCDRDFASIQNPFKSLVRHVNKDHFNFNPDGERARVWMAAAKRGFCPTCRLSYGLRQKHNCLGAMGREFAPLQPVLSQPDLSQSQSQPEVSGEATTCLLPDLLEILSTPIPTVKRIPQQCRALIAKAYTTIMRNCSKEGTPAHDIRAWKLQFLFCKCVLRMQPEIRGGKKKKLRRNENLKTALLERLKRWNEGKVDVLWAEARKLYTVREPKQAEAGSIAANIRRATECAQDARYGKAVAALLSLGTSPVTPETVREMELKHPEALPPHLPPGDVPDAVQFDEGLVRKKVEGFPTGSAAGASATRPQFFKDMISCPNKAVAGAALSALTKLTNHMVAGKAPRELAPFIAGAPLMALVKQGGGLRPIAIGETIRRLVSKCCCEATVEDTKILFGPLQVGVATQGGAEASIHAVRRLAKEFGEDPGKIMLKVDFSNAFNSVDRTEMLAQVHEKLPGLYRWVEYCYSQPAHLFFGSCLLKSMAGVQQGDPLGPLLFSLVLHPLALKIQEQFARLDLCVWYLDDGTIVGPVDEVYQVFKLLQEKGPALGLHLNVSKNELWWPNRASEDPFPAEVERLDNAGVKLLGAPIGTRAFTIEFVKKKLKLWRLCASVSRKWTTLKLSSVCFVVVCRLTRSITCCALAPVTSCVMFSLSSMGTSKVSWPRYCESPLSRAINGARLLCP